MAIDTAEKRKSIRGIGGRRVAPGVTPNAAQDQEWRQEAGRSYSGILAEAVAYTFRSGIRLFTAANWSPDRDIVFEASIRATAGTARARLFNVTAAAAVANSEVTTTSSSMTRLRSAAITLVDGNEYRMQTGKAVGSTGFYLAGHNLWI